MFRELALRQGDGLKAGVDMSEIGQAANGFASAGVFQNFRERKAHNTLRRHDANLNVFADFLRSTGASVGDLAGDPEAWRGMTWGLVAAYQRWLLSEGYALGTVNVMVSTVKAYSKLAFRAGVLGPAEYALISGVEGYAHKERSKVDDKRAKAAIPTRLSTKKAEAVRITSAQAKALKLLAGVDGLMFCLLLDHGLRLGELAALQADNFDLAEGVFRFYRPKVGKVQTHEMTKHTLAAAKAVLGSGAEGRLFISERGLAFRIKALGAGVGLEGFSAHDCRHYCATYYANRLTLRALMDKFGWSSPAMAARYMQSSEIISSGD